jgi:DNA-binding SARP family transcriptional activator
MTDVVRRPSPTPAPSPWVPPVALATGAPAPAVRLLGALRVLGPDGAVDLGGRKPRALLTLLVIHAGRPVSVDRLIEAVWGDDPPARCEATLQSYVSRLRRVLDGIATITAREPGYVVEIAAGHLDVAQAEALVGEGRVALAAGDATGAKHALERAVAMWEGRPLDEFADEDWARPEANRLAELRLAAWEDLADARLVTGDHRHLVADLEPLVAEAPLREGLIARLVLALARSGRQVDGLAVLRRHRELLVEELGLDPGPELERLEQGLLAQAPDVVGAPAGAATAPAPGGSTSGALSPAPDPGDTVAGREAEADELRSLVSDLAGGLGGIVLLSGEPGIGKSHLVGWCLEHLGADSARPVVGRLRATEDAAGPPLWPWRVALDEVLGSGTPLPPPDSSGADDPYEVRLAVSRALAARAAEQPVLIVADDLQWLDPGSLGLLQFLAAETGRAAIAVLATCRTPGADPPRPLAACLDELARQPGARWLRLEGLDEAGAGAVAAGVVGRPVLPTVTRALHERTGGNPFLLRELARQLALERREDDPEAVRDPRVLPPTVLEGVRRRVDLLPEDVAEVLRMAAVAGGDPDVALLAAGTDLDIGTVLAALERACAADLLVADAPPAGLRFAHSLIAEALLESLGPVGRARRHLAVLTALAPPPPVGEDRLLPVRARHAVEALPLGDPGDALALVVGAAEQAQQRGAPEEAATWWRQALDLARPDPATPDARWRALDGLARAQLAAGDLAAGLAAVLDACAEAERLGEPHLLARSATAVVQLSLWPWRNYLEVDRRMVRTLERAVATLGDDEPATLVRALAGLGVERYYLADPAPADEASARAVALARAIGDPELLALALDLRFVAVWRPDRMAEMESVADELVATAEASGLDDRTLFVGTFLRLVARLTQGTIETAREDEALCLALADRLRTPSLLVVFDAYRAMRATLDGDFDQADRWIAEGMELHRRTQVWPAEDARLGLIAPLAIERGGAHQLVDGLFAAADSVAEGRAPLAFGMIVLAETGDAERLQTELAARGPLPERSQDWAWLAMTCGFAGIAALAGDRAAARRRADDLAPYAGQLALFGSDGCFGAVDEFRGRCLALLDDSGAESCFEAATELHRRLAAPHLEARTRLHHAEWLAARDPARARVLLDEAARLAARAPALAARIAAALSRSGPG